MRLVLASQSPYRRLLLERLGVPFIQFDSKVDETALAGESAYDLVMRLAIAKAQSYPSGNTPHLTIGADQVGCYHNHILTKPKTIERACAQLQLVSGQRVVFYSGMCLYNSLNGNSQTLVHQTQVVFRSLSSEEILAYVHAERPLHACGSFQVEGLGITLVESITSDDPTGLIGLPLIHLSSMLRRAGFPFAQQANHQRVEAHTAD